MFFYGFKDELEKCADIPLSHKVLGGLVLGGAIALPELIAYYGLPAAMRGVEKVSPQAANIASGALTGIAAEAVLKAITKGDTRVTKGPALVGALGGALWPEIKKKWQEL